jgi:hypothetical protein
MDEDCNLAPSRKLGSIAEGHIVWKVIAGVHDVYREPRGEMPAYQSHSAGLAKTFTAAK